MKPRIASLLANRRPTAAAGPAGARDSQGTGMSSTERNTATVRRYGKTLSAGSKQRQAGGLRRVLRGAFATRDVSSDANGTGAPSHALALALASMALVLLVLSPAASAAVSPKGVTGYFGATGIAAGQTKAPRGVAVNQGNGNVYAVDGENNRVVEFNSSGEFLRAWGQNVVLSGPDQANAAQTVTVTGTGGSFTLTATTGAGVGTLTNGSKQVIGVATAAGGFATATGAFHVGDAVSGTGIPAGTTIATIGAGTLELSQAAAGSGNQTLTAKETTAAIEWNAPASSGAGNVQAALTALPGVGAGNLSVGGGPGNATGSTPYLVTFAGALGGRAQANLAAASSLTGAGAGATVAVVNAGETGFEICNAKANPSDICIAGTAGETGGAMNGPQGVAVNQSTGNVYVTDQNNRRVDQFDENGSFIRAFGSDVVSAGPDQASETQTATVNATGGNFSLTFEAKTTGATGTGNLAEGSTTIENVATATGAFIAGEAIAGAGIPAGTTIATVNEAEHKLTLSAAVEAGGTATGVALTANLPATASASVVQSALNALSTIGGRTPAASVSVSGGPGNAGGANPYVIGFGGSLARVNVAQISATNVSLSGGSPSSSAATATTNEGATGFEACGASDVCKAGASASTAGAFLTTFSGYPAVAPGTAPNAGDVLVADSANRRVQEFTSSGAFVRAFGFDVVSSGPDNTGSTFEVCKQAVDICQIGAAGSGPGQFGGTSTTVTGPNRVAEDSTGAIYTVESLVNFRVQKFTLPSNVVTPPAGAFDTTDIPGESAKAPTEVAIDPATGDVLVTRAFAAGATASCPITGTSSSAEVRVLEIASGGSKEAEHGICAGIASSNGLSMRTSASGGNVYLSSNSTTASTESRLYVLNTGQPAAPSAQITNVSGVGAHAATISAFVNPGGPELPYGNNTTYRFEYKRTADSSYGPLGSGEASAGNRNVTKLLTQQLEGLQAATSYDVRLIAKKPFGSGEVSNAVSFTTATAAPEVSLPRFVNLVTGGAVARFSGTVDPNNSATTYRFEYGSQGPCSSNPCVSLPSPAASAGAGVAPVAVGREVGGLEPGATYHLRLTATNGAGSATTPEETFTPEATGSCPNESIREQQGAEVVALPDCMGLEMVSPTQKFQQPTVAAMGISPDNERVLYRAQGALAETPQLTEVTGDPYVAERLEGSGGWKTRPTSPPAEFPGKANGMIYSFAPDFSSWFVLASTSEQKQLAQDRAFQGSLDGSFTSISPLLIPSLNTATIVSGSNYQGASADHSHLFFGIGKSEGNAAKAGYLPGDPEPQPITSVRSRSNAYVANLDSAGQPSVELLARDGAGRVWGGNCGARLGGDSDPSLAGAGTGVKGIRNQGAIASDGSRAYFSARPTQPLGGNCEITNNKLRILKREETPSGVQIGELISSQCSRVSPACDATNGDDIYNGASADGAKVYFTTTRQLVGSDLDSGAECSSTTAVQGCDLYLYDATLPPGQRLIQVSAGDSTDPTPGAGAKVYNGTVAISGDGSHVYFVAQGVLTTHPNPEGATAEAGKNNLYLYERDEANPGGRLAFVGPLSSAESSTTRWGGSGSWTNGAYAVPVTGKNSAGVEVGGDGHILVFETKASLVAGDADEGRLDAYRYDADTSPPTLECVSCRPGGPDKDAIELADYGLSAINRPLGTGPGTDFAERGRWVSEDGDSILFTTPEGLLPGDVVSATAATTSGSKILTEVITAKGAGTLASGSTGVTGVTTSTGAFEVGQAITGPGILTTSGSGTLTAGSKEVTGVTGAFEVGQRIAAPGIPGETTIAAVGAGTLTLSAFAQASGSKALTANTTIAAVGAGTLTLSVAATASGSAALAAGPQPLAVSQAIVGPGIPAGSTIAAVEGQTVTLSSTATATATGVTVSGSFTHTYLWRDGQLYRLPGSAESALSVADAGTVISLDGSEVAFQSNAELLPQDGDTVKDVYLARPDGGYPISIEHHCTGEECQEPFSAQPTGQAAASEVETAGNPPAEKPARCRKGFVRRHGKCVKKHHKKHAHRKTHKRHANPDRRAAK